MLPVTPSPFPTPSDIQRLAEAYPEVDQISVEACLAFLHTTSVVYGAFDAHFARYGLSRGKFTVLMQLFTKGQAGLKPSDFAEEAGVTRATITRLIDGLVRDELVERRPHPGDRRMLLVFLTSQGKQLLEGMLPDHFCRTTALFDNLSEQEKATFVSLLNKLQSGSAAMATP